jgi:hypothetical protein
MLLERNPTEKVLGGHKNLVILFGYTHKLDKIKKENNQIMTIFEIIKLYVFLCECDQIEGPNACDHLCIFRSNVSVIESLLVFWWPKGEFTI